MSLLEEVPSILDYVTPNTMAALLSSSSSLRRLVHTSATALTLKKADLPDITALVDGGWPQLKQICQRWYKDSGRSYRVSSLSNAT